MNYCAVNRVAAVGYVAENARRRAAMLRKGKWQGRGEESKLSPQRMLDRLGVVEWNSNYAHGSRCGDDSCC